MIFEKTRDIMLKGIGRHAQENGLQANQVQIRIVAAEAQGELKYTMCEEWQPKKDVTFLQIMGRKVDLLGYQYLSTPFMLKSIEKFAKDHEGTLENTSAFLSKYKDSIAVSVFKDTECVRSLTLEKHFAEMGM
jgi:hypothetical protein